MIVACQLCRTQLNVPDQAGGKQVQCPKCKGVFAVVAAAAASAPLPVPAAVMASPPSPPSAPSAVAAIPPAPAAPPALPPQVQPPGHAVAASPPPPLVTTTSALANQFAFDDAAPSSPIQDFDFDGGELVTSRYPGGRGGTLLMGAIMLLIAPVIDLAFLLIFAAQFGGGAYLAGVLAGLLLRMAVLHVLPAVFMIIGYVKLRQRRTKGLVITAGILAIALPTILLLLSGLSLIRLLSMSSVPGIAFMAPVIYIAAAALAIAAGIGTLVCLGDKGVSDGFARNAARYDEEYRDRPARREREY